MSKRIEERLQVLAESIENCLGSDTYSEEHREAVRHCKNLIWGRQAGVVMMSSRRLGLLLREKYHLIEAETTRKDISEESRGGFLSVLHSLGRTIGGKL